MDRSNSSSSSTGSLLADKNAGPSCFQGISICCESLSRMTGALYWPTARLHARCASKFPPLSCPIAGRRRAVVYLSPFNFRPWFLAFAIALLARPCPAYWSFFSRAFNFLTGEQWMASKGLRALSSSTSSGHPRRRSSSGTLCLSAYLQISRAPWHHTGSIGGMTSSVRNPWSASRGTTPWEASSVTSGLLSKLCRSPKAPLLSTQAWLRGSRHLRRDR